VSGRRGIAAADFLSAWCGTCMPQTTSIDSRKARAGATI
jgi:hypothetical protein